MSEFICLVYKQVKDLAHRVTSGPRMRWPVPLVLLALLGCSNQSVVVVPAGTASSRKILGKGGIADASVSGQILKIDFTPPSAAEQSKFASFATATALSFVSPTLIAGTSSLGGAVVEVSNGILSSPQVIPLPAFASGGVFLPVAAQGKDFWLVQKNGDSTDVLRPLSPSQGELNAELPPHSKVSLKASAQVIGFSADILILRGQGSLWYVKREGEKIKAFEIPLPEGAEAPVAAGAVFGDQTERFWIAGGSNLWLYTNDNSGWLIRKHTLSVKSTQDKIALLAGHFVTANGSLELKNTAIAKFGNQMMSVGLRFGGESPVSLPQVSPLTFAEARSYCDSCHATNSNNQAALKALSGTENLATWKDNKSSIAGAVQSDFMPYSPSAKLSGESKTRFLLFAQDPK
ncbi:MAG: hypothetical protein RIR26_1917 [Pseudomonadota bacterium]